MHNNQSLRRQKTRRHQQRTRRTKIHRSNIKQPHHKQQRNTNIPKRLQRRIHSNNKVIPMNLITLIETLESKLKREIVSTIDGSTVSYTENTPKTITINSTDYPETNRVCLLSRNNTTKLYISAYQFKKLTKIDISTINTITIT